VIVSNDRRTQRGESECRDCGGGEKEMRERGTLNRSKKRRETCGGRVVLRSMNVTMNRSSAMMKKLFTERRDGAKPRVQETLDDVTRNGLIGARILASKKSGSVTRFRSSVRTDRGMPDAIPRG
jgi:hypothetical protein